MISHDKSLIGPLSSTLGLEDMYNLLEVIQVDAHNERVMDKWRRERDKG